MQSTQSPDVRTDRPADLNATELLAYRIGYSRGVAKYLKDNGTPAAAGPVPARDSIEYAVWRKDLHARTVAFQEGAHEVAQPSAMRSLAAYHKRIGITPKRAPRKVATKVSPVDQDVIAAAVSGAQVTGDYQAAIQTILQTLGMTNAEVRQAA